MEQTEKQVIFSQKAPAVLGPYSQAIQAGNLVFTAGQVGLDPRKDEIVAGGIEAETRQVLNNLKNVLEAAGASMEKVVKTTVYLRDMNDFSRMNAVYAEFFPANPPARATVQVAALPRGAAIEIEGVAITGL